ncbi:unnamed protein product [Dicrocoelium dendriticum]|nr:unnamed protein product [Dicrocoelium dendriticum]
MAVAENRPLSFCSANLVPRCPQNPWTSALERVLVFSSDSPPTESNFARRTASKLTCPRPPVIRITNSSVNVEKLSGIINYLQQPLHEHLLCPTHAACIEETLPKLRNLLQQRIRDAKVESPRCSCCCGTAEDLVRFCTAVGHQINRCTNCRCKLSKVEDEPPEMRTTVSQCKRPFRSPFKQRAELKTSVAADGTVNEDSRLSTPDGRGLQPEAPKHTDRCVDKSDYCWQWLLYSSEVGTGTTLNGFRDDMSSGTVPSSSMSDLSTNSDRRSKSAPPEDALSPGAQSDVASAEDIACNDRKRRYKHSTRFNTHGTPSPMDNCFPEPQDRCTELFGKYEQYPCSVKRRPELRNPDRGYSTDRIPDHQLESPLHTQTPWMAVRTENKFDSALWTALSAISLSAGTQVSKQQQQKQQQRDLRTIQFLSSVSPNMQLRPPPNHNPFAKNESI